MEKELLTVCTEEDLQNGLIDENGGIYSPDGSRFLKFTGNGEEYTVKEGVEVICEKAFYNPRANSKSNSLKKISLPDSCKKIDNGAFAKCVSLKELVLPKELKTIGWEAFENCYSLEHIQFPEYLQTVKGFNGCVSLTKLVLPKCKNIAQKAFCACRKLNEVVLPEGLEYIGRNAFYKTALRQITLPESLNEMKNPFSAPVEVEILSPNFKVVDDVIYSADGTELVAILEEETSFVVPENVKTIGDGALANLEALETVYLPEGLEKVKNCDEFNWVTTICIPPKTKDKFIPLVDQWAGVTNNKKKLKVVR